MPVTNYDRGGCVSQFEDGCGGLVKPMKLSIVARVVLEGEVYKKSRLSFYGIAVIR
jgi:hypothetical protein